MTSNNLVPSNQEFLREVFGIVWPRAIVVSFRGDPSTAPVSAWGGRLASEGVPSDPDANNYYCVSTFNCDADGIPRRQRGLFRAFHALVLSEVGQKLPIHPVLTRMGAPSYRVETSPGSEEWGYILGKPETNAMRVNALLTGMIRRGLHPAGVNPNQAGVTRLARLPIGSTWAAQSREMADAR